MSNVVEKTRYMEVSLKHHTREKCLSITCPVEENVSCVFHAVTGSSQGIFFPMKWNGLLCCNNKIHSLRNITRSWSCFWLVVPRGNFGFQPIISTTKIWVVTRHQYGISALVTQTWFSEGSSGDLAKRRLFTQATKSSICTYALLFFNCITAQCLVRILLF